MTDVPLDPETTGEPIVGEAVTTTAIVPSAESNKAQGRLNIARTGVQTSLPGALVVVGTWAFLLAGVDLDPGAGTDMPATVAAAFTSIGTILGAYLMNRGKLRGEG